MTPIGHIPIHEDFIMDIIPRTTEIITIIIVNIIVTMVLTIITDIGGTNIIDRIVVPEVPQAHIQDPLKSIPEDLILLHALDFQADGHHKDSVVEMSVDLDWQRLQEWVV